MQKRTIIKKIKSIIAEHGSFTTADVEANGSPCIASLGKDTHQLAEEFFQHKVKAVIYVHETETSEDFIAYEDLSKDVLEDILLLAEDYEAEQIRTEKRCSN
jgi:hypothetical protein